MKNLFFILLTTALSFSLTAQEKETKNYIVNKVSYAFFGTGDLSGTSLGISYSRMFFDKLGVNVGYTKSAGSGNGLVFKQEKNTITNINLEGSGKHAFENASYHSYNLGAAYKVADGDKHVLLVTAGLNIKSLKYSYPNGIYSAGQDDGTFIRTITNFEYYAGSEMGYYVALDYMIFFNQNLGMGIHGSFENSSNVLSHAGISLAYKI